MTVMQTAAPHLGHFRATIMAIVAGGALMAGALAVFALSTGNASHAVEACQANPDAGTLAANGCAIAPAAWNPAGSLPAALFPAAVK